MFNPHVDQGRAYIRYVCKELLNHPTFKSDLVLGLACFDYAVLFTLPKDQLAGCCSRLFHSFCVRGWLAKELKNIHLDDYMEFKDVFRFFYLDELHNGPKIEDMLIFLSSSPELAKQEQTAHVFKLCCLCFGHVVPKLPSVTLRCRSKSAAVVDLSDIIEPLQSYLLSSSAERSLPMQSQFRHVWTYWMSSEIKQFNHVMTLGLVWFCMTGLRYMLISPRHIRK